MIKTFYALNRTNKTENTDIFGVSLYQFVRKHTAKMAGKFYSIISEEEMEDLVHDTYIKVCEKKGNVTPRGQKKQRRAHRQKNARKKAKNHENFTGRAGI